MLEIYFRKGWKNMISSTHFYIFGRGYPPKDWFIDTNLIVNRLYYIYGGSAFFTGGDVSIPLQKQHLYLFPRGLNFSVHQDDENPVDHLFFDFLLSSPLAATDLIDFYLPPGDTPIWHLVEALSCMLINKPYHFDDDYTVNSIFDALLALLSAETGLSYLNDERLNTALDYIHKNLSEKISIKSIAEMLFMEENYFIRYFKKFMGITPYKYLREYRLNKAVNLINNGMTLCEAAGHCGYDSVSALSHALNNRR